MHHRHTDIRLSRRTALVSVAGIAGATLLAACGETAAPTAAPAAPTARPTTAATAASTVATTAPTTAGATVAPTVAAAGATAAATTAPMVAPVATTATTATTAAPAAAMTAPTAAPMMAGGMTANVEGRLAGANGVPDAWTKLPPPYKTVNAIPGKGGTITGYLINYDPPPPPRENNRFWQELERRIGAKWEPILQPADGYPEKTAALTASGNLPDITLIVPEQVPDQYRVIRQGAYTDLTPFLTGSELRQYPNLAAFPEYLWKNSAVGGKIYGVPNANNPIPATLHWRKDWAEKLGTPAPKNAEDIARIFTAFSKNDPDGNGAADSFGMGSIAQFIFNLPFFLWMFRVPNNWRLNPDGTLTNHIETPEFREAVTYMRRLFDAGVFHPETATMNRTQRRDYLVSGKVGANMDSVVNFTGLNGFRAEARKVAPVANIVPLVPPGHDGGQPSVHLAPGFFSISAIPARVGRDRERVKELLRVLDFFSAPFGSEERNFLAYGIEGVHHEARPDGNRIINDLGRAERGGLTSGGGPPTSYFSPLPGESKELQDAVAASMATGIQDPTLTAFSAANAMRSGELNQLRIDRIGAIVQGREPLTALDGYVRDWRSRGGDTIRKEFQDALKMQ